ncbi:MAG: sulfatase-like hydrolase/transferase [Chloroflexi bacterium]|nr:sulfatase-like hydrolase/transferase [Chloroflexota bacterium]
MAERHPNFLVVMTDQHNPIYSGAYGHALVRTPNMDRLARQGVTFEHAYCNTPLCAPGRISFMTGRYPHHLEAWDNATPHRSDLVTWAHHLRPRGYDVVLSGKMHFLGPDPLHGFRAQLAFDLHATWRHPIYTWREADGPVMPAKDYREPAEAHGGMTEELEVDDRVEAAALAYLRDPARREQPFALCVGFIAPHGPWIVPEPYYSMYDRSRVALPTIPPGHLENLPLAARVLRARHRMVGPYTDDEIRNTRAAYFGMVTRLDAQIGRLLDCLEEQGLADDTVVIHTSDHGESLGEHSLWRKSTFYEHGSRIPLQIAWPGHLPAGTRRREVVSLVDVTATMLDLVGLSATERAAARLDGDSLLPLLHGETSAWKDEAFVEYTAHGNDRPRAMVRRGRWKLAYGYDDPPQLELYDLAADPGEFTNLANRPEHREVQEALLARLLDHWDPATIDGAVIRSQRERRLIRQAVGEELF